MNFEGDTSSDDGARSFARSPGVKVTKRPPKKSDRSKKMEAVVDKTMTVNKIITMYPQTTEILSEYGLHCFGCAANDMESLEEGCIGHGFSDDDIENLVHDLNEAIALLPPRPQTLSITTSAAEKLSEIGKGEGKNEMGLSVMADEHGGFFLEFRDAADFGDKTFPSKDIDTVKLFASPLTLQRIGGSVIDFRDGRFKLDIEIDTKGCACGGKCDC